MKKFYLSLIALLAFTFNAMAQTELWSNDFTLDTYFATGAGWAVDGESSATVENGVVTVTIGAEKDAQWQGQVKLVTKLTNLSADKQYDFSCKANCSQAVGGVTFKMMNNVEMKYENQSINLAEGENTISETNIDGNSATSDGTIVFDFGWALAGTTIVLSDFSLVEHDAVAPEPVVEWDATASNNLWPANLTPGSYWYAPGWSQIADPAITVNGDRSFTLSFPSATTDQWQAQVHMPSGIMTSAVKNYDFQVVLNSTLAQPGATIKFVKVGDDNSFYCADRHNLTAGADYVYQLENVAGIDMDELKLVLDFGGNAANTDVTVRDIVVREHNDFTPEATEYGLVGDFNNWSSDENGLVFYTTEDANVLKATTDSFTTGQWGFKVRKGTGWDNLWGRDDAMSTGEAAAIVAGGNNIFLGQECYNTTLTNAVFTLGLDAEGNPATLTVTADQDINVADFVDSYMMVGAFQGWSFENNPLKFTYDKTNKNYTASIDQIQGEFKIVKNSSWDGALAGVTDIVAGNTYNLIAGGDNAGFASTINNAKFTLTIASDGNATLQVEGENVETETTYGLVGEFNSWNNNDENYLLTKQEDGTYTIHVTDFPCGKAWKVSHNKSWKCFLGNGTDNTVTVGTPYACVYGDNNNNLSINGEGTFTGTITLSDIVAETSATITLTEDATIAELVSVTPEPGSNVGIDTEYVLTFSKPVTYTTYYSDITIGMNPFGNNDGATFTQNDDKTEIHAKLDAANLAQYGITTIDQAVAYFGTSLALHVYGVKDLATGQALEYNDPDDETQFTYNYVFGEPVIKIDPKDGAELDSLETVYFAYADGIAIADGTQKITVVKGETVVYETTADQLSTVAGEYGAPGYYSMTVNPVIKAAGEYTVQIPAGTFALGGTANKYTEATYTIEGGTEPQTEEIHVSPASGVVESLQTFVFTYGNNEAIMPFYNDDKITITNEKGEEVRSIKADDLRDGGSEYVDDEWNPTLWQVTLANAITDPGTYTMTIPAKFFTVTKDTEFCEETTFTWTIEGTEPTPAKHTTVAFGTTTDPRPFTAQTVLASVNGWESDVLPDGNKVAITQDPAGMGKFWSAHEILGTWTNDAALAELVDFTGLELTAADFSEGSPLLFAANSNGGVTSSLVLRLDAQSEKQGVTFYTTTVGWNCPLDAVTVTGLDDLTIQYATNDGDGFVKEPTFTQDKQGINLLKITGNLTADKTVTVTSPTTVEIDGSTYTAKNGFQLVSYNVTDESVPTLISNVNANENDNDAIYNIAGQRVKATAKGILIKNGKKYLNK